jgi:hypothetical protein
MTLPCVVHPALVRELRELLGEEKCAEMKALVCRRQTEEGREGHEKAGISAVSPGGSGGGVYPDPDRGVLVMILRFNSYFVYFYWLCVAVSILAVLWILGNRSDPAYKIA